MHQRLAIRLERHELQLTTLTPDSSNIRESLISYRLLLTHSCSCLTVNQVILDIFLHEDVWIFGTEGQSVFLSLLILHVGRLEFLVSTNTLCDHDLVSNASSF